MCDGVLVVLKLVFMLCLFYCVMCGEDVILFVVLDSKIWLVLVDNVVVNFVYGVLVLDFGIICVFILFVFVLIYGDFVDVLMWWFFNSGVNVGFVFDFEMIVLFGSLFNLII